jgi:hypothetical protein
MARLLGAIGLIVALATGIAGFVRKPAGPEYNYFALLATFALATAGWLYFRAQQRRLAPGLAVTLVLLALVEINNVSTYGYRAHTQPFALHHLHEDRDLAAFFRSQPAPFRISVDHETLGYNFGDWFALDQFEGYFAGMLATSAATTYEPVMHNLMGVRFHIAKDAPYAHWRHVFTSRRAIKVFEDPGAFPRAWAVHRISVQPSADAVRESVVHPGRTDLRRVAVLSREPGPLEQCEAPEEVTLATRSTNSLTLRVRLACRGLIVLGETYAPGWRAWVDGVETEVLPVNYSLQGVVAGTGSHEIVFQYRPSSARWGAALGLLGVVLCAALATGTRGWARIRGRRNAT